MNQRRAWTLGYLAGQLAQQGPGSEAAAEWLRDAAALLRLPAGETWNASRLQGLGQALLVSISSGDRAIYPQQLTPLVESQREYRPRHQTG